MGIEKKTRLCTGSSSPSHHKPAPGAHYTCIFNCPGEMAWLQPWQNFCGAKEDPRGGFP